MPPRGAALLLRAAALLRATPSAAPPAPDAARCLATKASASAAAAAPAAAAPAVAKKDWSAVAVPAESSKPPTTVAGGQAYGNDLRSTSGLGAGDGIATHTAKWLQPAADGAVPKTPMEWIREAEPIEVHAPVVASTGGGDPALGCPVEYINLKGTTRERPAVCKYTGDRFWAPKEYWGGAH
jgi:NADH dehydrogenase (ubiquinone) Fe-S protein 6